MTAVSLTSSTGSVTRVPSISSTISWNLVLEAGLPSTKVSSAILYIFLIGRGAEGREGVFFRSGFESLFFSTFVGLKLVSSPFPW